MAHKTKINGTTYDINGGSCKVNGTKYNINKGKTKINGTGYDISFLPNTVVTVRQTPQNEYWLRDIYASVNGGMHLTGYPVQTVEVDSGINASLYIYAPHKYGGWYYVYIVNGKTVETNAVFLSETIDVTGKSVNVEFLYERGTIITISVDY